ncbi:MAG: 2-amino-4-hydroxy-6-hydroxymethyldihydropteridine diphosphokinase [Gammaproteobacteria bacterium]|nr:2-amino-4-hydroxy-6-hydroxymethyldihydropteridine diphosphokinase [Gammaproteobacteria bacterium]
MATTIRAYVGIGANLDEPREQVVRAFKALEDVPRTQLRARSSLYHSRPMGSPMQPDYVNAAALIETALLPHQLLDELQRIEGAQGRIRGALRWQARTLDLDLLLYGTWRVRTPRLTVPHPGLHERDFVLAPLAELTPDLVLPRYGAVKDVLEHLGRASKYVVNPALATDHAPRSG